MVALLLLTIAPEEVADEHLLKGTLDLKIPNEVLVVAYSAHSKLMRVHPIILKFKWVKLINACSWQDAASGKRTLKLIL